MAQQVGTLAAKPVKILSPISKIHMVGENAPGKLSSDLHMYNMACACLHTYIRTYIHEDKFVIFMQV